MQELSQQTLYTILGIRTINSLEKDIHGSPIVSCVYVKVEVHSVSYYDE